MSAALAAAGAPEPPAAELPERVLAVLDAYTEGLKHLVIKTHPWVVNGWARRPPDERLAAKGRELLDFLEMAPTVKNAKKVGAELLPLSPCGHCLTLHRHYGPRAPHI